MISCYYHVWGPVRSKENVVESGRKRSNVVERGRIMSNLVENKNWFATMFDRISTIFQKLNNCFFFCFFFIPSAGGKWSSKKKKKILQNFSVLVPLKPIENWTMKQKYDFFVIISIFTTNISNFFLREKYQIIIIIFIYFLFPPLRKNGTILFIFSLLPLIFLPWQIVIKVIKKKTA